ncbi:hypothetical protein PA257_5675 [Pseudomonas aeruginosa]|nr:hypothetical protein PA257_5675 [Pseudomonas aeruginosa]
MRLGRRNSLVTRPAVGRLRVGFDCREHGIGDANDFLVTQFLSYLAG